MNAISKRAEQYHLPVAELIAGSFDSQGLLAGHEAHPKPLSTHIRADVARRRPIQKMRAFQPVETIGGVELVGQRSQEAALSQS